MARLRTIELSDVVSRLPEVIPFELPADGLDRTQEMFICVLGFEPRYKTIPYLLMESGYRYHTCIYFVYATNASDNEVNRPGLLDCLERMSDNVETIPVDSQEFSQRLRSFLDNLVRLGISPCPRVTFDISVAANRLVMNCLAILLEYDIELTITYSEAAIYHPTKQEYEEDKLRWRDQSRLGLERGVFQIDVSREYPGQHLDPLPDSIIIVPTFKPDRSKAVISRIDPALLQRTGDKVVWLLGVPHLEENYWRVQALREINELPEFVPQIEVSTFDYKQILRVLEDLHGKRMTEYRLTLCTLGSKLQAVGASLFCYMHPDVRVMFAIPQEYNAKQFSEGCLARWKIDFSSLKILKTLLNKVGIVEIEG
jgi:hypothetical protein